MEPTDVLSPDLSEAERQLLRWGLIEWGGPARCTDEMAVAMGFADVRDLFETNDRLVDALETRAPLTALDWVRVLLATEIVFASNTIGSGLDWSITFGSSDEESLRLLRSVQRKLAGVGNVIGVAFGTRYRRPTSP
jgi:hypothetical protein